MFKDTPLLSAITVVELLHRAQLIGKETFRFVEPITLVGVIYLIASVVSARGLAHLGVRFRVGRSA